MLLGVISAKPSKRHDLNYVNYENGKTMGRNGAAMGTRLESARNITRRSWEDKLRSDNGNQRKSNGETTR